MAINITGGYKPPRTYESETGSKSTGTGSVETLILNIQRLMDMFNPDSEISDLYSDDTYQGGIGEENLQEGAVVSSKIEAVTLNDATTDDLTGTLGYLAVLSGLGKMIKSVSGEVSWSTVPSENLLELANRLNLAEATALENLSTVQATASANLSTVQATASANLATVLGLHDDQSDLIIALTNLVETNETDIEAKSTATNLAVATHTSQISDINDDMASIVGAEWDGTTIVAIMSELASLNTIYSTDSERIEAINSLITQYENADAGLLALITNKVEQSDLDNYTLLTQLATTTENGLMTAVDKMKLDDLTESATLDYAGMLELLNVHKTSSDHDGQYYTQTAINSFLAPLTSHIANTTLHVTTEDKTAWNKAVSDIANEVMDLSTNQTVAGEKTFTDFFNLDFVDSMVTSNYLKGFNVLCADLASGHKNQFSIGRSKSINNCAEITWHNVSAGSASNYMDFGIYGAGTIFSVFANKSVSFIGNVAVGGTVDGRDLATDGARLDGIFTGTLTIPITGWVDNTGDYAKKVVISVTGVTADHLVDVYRADPADKAIMDTAKFSEDVTEGAGTITLYAQTIPTATIACKFKAVK